MHFRDDLKLEAFSYVVVPREEGMTDVITIMGGEGCVKIKRGYSIVNN
ncbi:hypothetical protein ACJIZ3_021105 [Penstemon smallii]|uniref:Uncharacterized protein n=1 Tax=Penstemon smallii TaxID=265156 RepID=A0ABD3SL18_9LAMI